MIVDLTWDEVEVAALTGIRRNIRTIHEGRHRGGGQTPADGWTDHIVGAIAELAVAKAFNRYPSRNSCDIDGDVGHLQVRSTVRGDHMPVQSYDNDDAPFVLVLGQPPHMRIVGWLYGHEAKRKEYWRTDVRKPAYFVPPSALRCIDELKP